MMTPKEIKELWTEVMAQKENEPAIDEIGNILDDYDVVTVLATIGFFRTMSPPDPFMEQVQWDLRHAQYRIFDWMGMFLDGFTRVHKHEPFTVRRDTLWIMEKIARKFVEYKGDVKELIAHLRRHDYDIDYRSEKIIEEAETCWNCPHVPTKENTEYIGDGDVTMEPVCTICEDCELHLTNTEYIRMENEVKASEEDRAKHIKEAN